MSACRCAHITTALQHHASHNPSNSSVKIVGSPYSVMLEYIGSDRTINGFLFLLPSLLLSAKPSRTVSSSYLNSSTITLINPPNHTPSYHTISLRLPAPKIQHLSDEQILALFTEGFFSGPVFRLESYLLRLGPYKILGQPRFSNLFFFFFTFLAILSQKSHQLTHHRTSSFPEREASMACLKYPATYIAFCGLMHSGGFSGALHASSERPSSHEFHRFRLRFQRPSVCGVPQVCRAPLR